MKKAGICVLGLTLPLLVLAALAGPVSAANVEFAMWVEDPAAPGTKITDLTGLAAGDYNLVVQARVLNNLTPNRYITPTNGTPKTGSYDIYAGLQGWGFSLLDSTGTGAGSSLNFIDTAGDGTWGTTASARANYGNSNPGLIDSIGFDVLCQAGTQTPSANLALAGNYGGYRVAYTGFSTTTGLGGTPGPAPNETVRWFTLVTGGFTYTGGYAQLSMDLDPGVVGQNVATNSGTSGATWGSAKVPAANVTAAPTLTFGTQGTAQELYDAQAQAGLDAHKGDLALVASWHHAPVIGGWWGNDENAWITLDASGAGDFANYQWKITDNNGSGSTLTLDTAEKITTVSVKQLMAAGFADPPRLQDNNGLYTFASVGLSVFDGAGNWGTADPASGHNALLLPEPASLVVLSLGAMGALLRRRRR